MMISAAGERGNVMKIIISKIIQKNLAAALTLGEDSSIVVSQGARPHQILNGTIDAGKEITYDKKAERESPPGTSQKG